MTINKLSTLCNIVLEWGWILVMDLIFAVLLMRRAGGSLQQIEREEGPKDKGGRKGQEGQAWSFWTPPLILSARRASEVAAQTVCSTAYNTFYLLRGPRVFGLVEQSCIATSQHFLLGRGWTSIPCSVLCPSAFRKAPWKQFIYNWLCAPLWEKRNERKGAALSVHCAL